MKIFIYFLLMCSGATALVYQVVWYRYLATLFGSHSQAAAITLSVFLCGLGLGYFIFGKLCQKKGLKPLRMYALTELGLAMWALLFPWLYQYAFDLTTHFYHQVGVHSVGIDILLSALLLGIPTILMGGTLPLLTQGLFARYGEVSRLHTFVYGFNTMGAGVGALLAGFFLVPKFGLDQTLLISALVNLCIFFAFLCLFPSEKATTAMVETKTSRFKLAHLLVLGVALFSGFYVICLETVLIRLVRVSVGASESGFALVVSVFVFGLGFASLFAKGIHRYVASRLFWNQLIVVVMLLSLYQFGTYAPYGAHLVRVIFRDIPENFYLYQILLGSFMFLFLAIPIGICGLTLPICFHLFQKIGNGVGKSVGQVYAINTIGSVLGAMLGGYYLLFYLNIDEIFRLCIWVAILSLITVSILCLLGKEKISLVAKLVCGIAIVGFSYQTLILRDYPNTSYFSASRHDKPIPSTFKGAAYFYASLNQGRNIFFEDGPNTSVGVVSYTGVVPSYSVYINGKSDGNTKGDLLTTSMLANFPALLAKHTRNVAIVGFGTGVTAGVFGLNPQVENVDVVEISHSLIKAAPLLDPQNFNVTENKKIKFHEMDAFRFLAGRNKQYDVIVSEPTNPWVQGVENLYSIEFYDFAKNSLSSDGMLVQWVNAYDFSAPLLKTIIKSMRIYFPHISIFAVQSHDLVLIGTQKPIETGDLQLAKQRMASNEELKKILERVGVTRLETVLSMEVMPGSVVSKFATGGLVQSVKAPKLAHAATKARFIGDFVPVRKLLRTEGYDLSWVRNSLQSKLNPVLSKEALIEIKKFFCKSVFSKQDQSCRESLLALKLLDSKWEIPLEHRDLFSAEQLVAIERLASRSIGTFAKKELKEIREAIKFHRQFYSPIAKIPYDHIVFRLDRCLVESKSNSTLYSQCAKERSLLLAVMGDAHRPRREWLDSEAAWLQVLESSYSLSCS